MAGAGDVRRSATEAKRASRRMATASSATKDRALVEMADALERRAVEILLENAEDVADGRKKGLSALRELTSTKFVVTGRGHVR